MILALNEAPRHTLLQHHGITTMHVLTRRSGTSNIVVPAAVRNALIQAIQQVYNIAAADFATHYLILTSYQLAQLPSLNIRYAMLCCAVAWCALVWYGMVL